MTTSSANTNRISGLVSGFDTDTLVKNLTLNIRTKIDEAKQQKQLLQWKQEDYRSIINKLQTFYTNYLNKTTGITSSGFFIQKSATASSSNYVSVTADATALDGSVVINDITSLATSSKLETSGTVSASNTIGVNLANLSGLSGKSMTVTVDGQSKLITFGNKTYDSVESVRAELASQVGAAFGTNYIAVMADTSSVTLSYDGGTIAISDSGISGSEASGVLSFTSGQSNRISLNKKISETSLLRPCGSTINFTINGQNFSFTGDNTIQQIMNKINSSSAGVKISYSSVSDKFTLTSTSTGTGNSITCTDTDGGFLSSILNGGNFTDGTNAVLQITSASGTQTITRRSNSFSIDGLNITLLGKADGDAAENITLTTSNNIDAVVDRIKTFVTDYNDMIKTVNTELTEERYRDYAPLTDDQKASLKDSDITLWQDKARSGMLKGDALLQGIYSGFRNAFISPIKDPTNTSANLDVTLGDIGISTGNYTDRGKLTIDETKLRQALAQNPQDVINFFTAKSTINYSENLTSDQRAQRNSESGVAWRISDIINDNIRKTLNSNGQEGLLLEAAGIDDDVTYVKNAINTKINSVDNSITKLNDSLSMYEKRYYAQFTAMEQALDKMNSQSSYISSFFSQNN